MKTNSSRLMRQLSDNEMASVAGGVIGAIPGYHVALPAGLFVTGGIYTSQAGVRGGTVQNTYTGDSGWVYSD
jgi:hypothetical protein